MSETPAEYDASPSPAKKLETWRCLKCGRVIFRAILSSGCKIEIKCKCNQINVIAA